MVLLIRLFDVVNAFVCFTMYAFRLNYFCFLSDCVRFPFLFPKQCLHYGVLAEHKGLVGVCRLPAQSETRKTHNFLRFSKKTELAFEF